MLQSTEMKEGKQMRETAVRVPLRVRKNILWNLLNRESALFPALTKIRPRTEVPACQKQAQSPH
jgi:hypothetical protein